MVRTGTSSESPASRRQRESARTLRKSKDHKKTRRAAVGHSTARMQTIAQIKADDGVLQAKRAAQAFPDKWVEPTERGFQRVVDRIHTLLPKDATKKGGLRPKKVQKHALALLAHLQNRAVDWNFLVDYDLTDIYDENSTIPKLLQHTCEYVASRVGNVSDPFGDDKTPWTDWLVGFIEVAQERVTACEELYSDPVGDNADYVLDVANDNIWAPNASDILNGYYECVAVQWVERDDPGLGRRARAEFQALFEGTV